MDEPSNSGDVTGRFRPPPELPKPLVHIQGPVVIGTALWLVAFVVLLLTGEDGGWRWTALAGAGLGVIGLCVIAWQRAASRRGTRGSHRGL